MAGAGGSAVGVGAEVEADEPRLHPVAVNATAESIQTSRLSLTSILLTNMTHNGLIASVPARPTGVKVSGRSPYGAGWAGHDGCRRGGPSVGAPTDKGGDGLSDALRGRRRHSLAGVRQQPQIHRVVDVVDDDPSSVGQMCHFRGE